MLEKVDEYEKKMKAKGLLKVEKVKEAYEKGENLSEKIVKNILG